jgi:pentatricopeptide repeat protein
VNAAALAASLDTPSGFAAVMKGMFRNGKAKKAHALWTSAQSKGVYETVELRFATHESTGYAVMAFSHRGPIDLRTRETLAAQAERFPLGTLRYESWVYSSLEPHGWHHRLNWDPNDHTIDAIADPIPGVRVFTAVTKPKGADRPLVAHCVVDGKDYIYPVPGDRLR